MEFLVIFCICSRLKYAIYLEVGVSTLVRLESLYMPFAEPHGGFGRLSRGHRPLEIPRSIPLLVGKIVPCASEARKCTTGALVHFLLCRHVVSRVGDAGSRDPGEAFVHLASRLVALQVLGVAVARDAAVLDASVVTPAAP